jgi:hypothetical protein
VFLRSPDVPQLADLLRRHRRSSAVTYLKHAGDGLLGVVGTVGSGIEIARAAADAGGQCAIHWGRIRRAALGDVGGPAVDAVLRVASATRGGITDVAITASAVEQLYGATRDECDLDDSTTEVDGHVVHWLR